MNLVVLGVLCIGWRGFLRRPPLPGHLVPGLGMVRWATVVGRLVSVGVASGQVLAGLLVVGLVLGWLERRTPHVGARQLAGDGVFLGVAALGMGGLSVWKGVFGGVFVLGALAVVFFATWGRSPRAVWMRQPHFRILADNPGARTAVARLRIDGRGWVVGVRGIGRGPVTLAVLGPSLQPVAHIGFDTLGPRLAVGPVNVRIGGTPGEELHLAVPPGLYWVSTRFYDVASESAAPPAIWRPAC